MDGWVGVQVFVWPPKLKKCCYLIKFKQIASSSSSGSKIIRSLARSQSVSRSMLIQYGKFFEESEVSLARVNTGLRWRNH